MIMEQVADWELDVGKVEAESSKSNYMIMEQVADWELDVGKVEAESSKSIPCFNSLSRLERTESGIIVKDING